MYLWCKIVGHKTMVKAFTGNKLDQNGVEMLLYKWQREQYCIRCGYDVWGPNYEEELREIEEKVHNE